MVEPSNVEIIFINSHQPSLTDGDYKMELTHTLSYTVNEKKAENITEKKTFSKTHNFSVRGERFSLSPDQIHKVFPPENSQGNYDNVLPHVVLKRRTFPWERAPVSGNNDSWLAVLVFTHNSAPKSTTGTLADLCQQSEGSLPDGTHSYGSTFKSMDKFIENGEAATDPCVYIDISKDQFSCYAPSLADLHWNAHARTKTKDKISEDYAVVVCNRLPLPGEGAVAHLVSLEGLGNQLPLDNGTIPATTTETPKWDTIRLVSLKSWSFHVSPLKASFTDVLKGLNGGINSVGKQEVELNDSQLRLPEKYLPEQVSNSISFLPFDSGYTVLEEQNSFSGENSAWYRGPFVPSIITPASADESWANELLPANEASELIIKVSASPSCDQSYAAAWEIGRLLALADKEFATAQVSWKRDCRLNLNTILGQKNAINGGSRAKYAQSVRAILEDEAKIKDTLGCSLITNSETKDGFFIPQKLVDWLGHLALLENVPFHYLIPDMNMLPTESIRFFNTDARWLACLLDGAWSLSREPKKLWAFDVAYQPWKQLMDGTLQTSFFLNMPIWPVSGSFINSQIIPGYWPGIDFFATTSTSTEATLLREKSLSPSTLLLLYDKVLKDITIQQPPEGIHFGFELNGVGDLSKKLRYVVINNKCYPASENNQPSGIIAPDNMALMLIPQRIPSVIQLDQLATLIETQIGLAKGQLTAAEFALEMIEGMSSATFILPNGGNDK